MEMIQTGRPIDVFRVACLGCDTPVERLADLADNDQIIDRPGPKRPEQVAPGRRQGPRLIAEKPREISPRIAYAAIAG